MQQTDSVQQKLRALLEALQHPNPASKRRSYPCRCPAPGHGKGRGDLSPSLTVTLGQDRVLVHCHAGCALEDILAALNLDWTILYASDRAGTHRGPDRDTRETLRVLEAWWWSVPWPYKSDRDLYKALIDTAWLYGRVDVAGVHVSLSRRDLALAAGISLRTTTNSVKRLRQARILSTPNENRHVEDAGTFLLLSSANATHELGESFARASQHPCVEVAEQRLPERMRAAAAVEGFAVKSIGKSAGTALDYLLHRGGRATVTELGCDLGLSRPRNARKHVTRLEDAGIVELDGQIVRVRRDWRSRLQEHRETSGQVQSERLDRADYEMQRAARWNYLRSGSEPDLNHEHEHLPDCACLECEYARLTNPQVFTT